MRSLLSALLLAFFIGQLTWAQSSPPQCTLQAGGVVQCVSADQCNLATNTVYDDGSDIFDQRFGGDASVCSPPQVFCCWYPHSEAATEQRARNDDASSPSGTAERCGFQKRQTIPGFYKKRSNEADPGEFPWTINLMIMVGMNESKISMNYAGTGALIHERVVLTGAQPLHDKSLKDLFAIVGDHDVTEKIVERTQIQATEVVMHHSFHKGTGNYNFALVFLERSALENMPHVGTVCLPPANFFASAGTRCVFSGWGADSSVNFQYQLTKTEVPMMTHAACQERLRQNPKLGPGFQLLSTYTCAGGEMNKDICGGGGGSPLVCPIENEQGRYVQTGIVSWTASCGQDGSPTVFADVAVARTWIDQQMTAHQYSTESYTY